MNYKKLQRISFFGTVILMLLFTISNNVWEGTLVFVFILVLGIAIILFPNSEEDDDYYYRENRDQTQANLRNYLVYHGDQLNFREADIVTALTRHFPYYTKLNFPDRQKFIRRLNKFIDDKIFKIHDRSGFREMPILISATAIQLSFGLEKYLLPNFTVINIYPEEYVVVRQTICVLEGHVSGHSINISWKSFLQGFKLPVDGQNVGLHEMAHAYYYQNFGPCDNKDTEFIRTFNEFNGCGNAVFLRVQTNTDILYSDYAKRNFQEFWAESVELFFEKPAEMRNIHPELYASIADLLNQDPVRVVA